MAATLGVVVGGGYQRIGPLAAGAEQVGLQTVWVHEADRDPFLQAATVATATSTIRIGTNVAVAFARSPASVAVAARDLADLSAGRFVLGLGSQVRAIVERRHTSSFERPISRMSEYLQAIDAMFRTGQGNATKFEGEIYRLTLPGAYERSRPDLRPPPVFLAAVGPQMTKLALRRADGLLGHPFTSLEFLAAQMLVKRRPRPDFELATGVIVSVDRDVETARRRAASQVGFYGTTPNYRPVLEAAGDGGIGDELVSAWRSGNRDLAPLVAEVVDRYAVISDGSDLLQRLAPYRELVDHLIMAPPTVGLTDDEITAATEAAIDAISG